MTKPELLDKLANLQKTIRSGGVQGFPLEVPPDERGKFVLLPPPISYSVEDEGTLELLSHIIDWVEQLPNSED